MARNPDPDGPQKSPCRSAGGETWTRYRGNLARYLIGISRDLESRVVQSLGNDGGYRGLRPSFGPFLSLIWEEGQPLSAIADELAISKQGCSQLANLIEDAGYLARKPNPTDRRSKVVSLTPRGTMLVEEGIRLILASESEYSSLVGRRVYEEFTKALSVLFEALGLPAHGDASRVARARRSVGVLPLIAVRIQRELMETTIARGHEGLKMSHGQVLPLIGSEGGRISEIARIQGVSRQAISVISKDLEALGYLRRGADPLDRRGVVLELTLRGETLIEDSVSALDGLESSFEEILGKSRMKRLRGGADALYRALRLEEAIFDSEDEATSSPGFRLAKEHVNRNELEDLASRLRTQLGSGGAARLASLLEPERTGSTT